jgi:hypothetical protein
MIESERGFGEWSGRAGQDEGGKQGDEAETKPVNSDCPTRCRCNCSASPEGSCPRAEVSERPPPPKPAKQFAPSVKKGRAKDWQGRRVEIDVPDGIIAHLTRECRGNVHDPHQSGHLGELFAVVGLRGGSRVTGGLSARGLANGPVGDWSDHLTFIMGDRHYRCPSSVV